MEARIVPDKHMCSRHGVRPMTGCVALGNGGLLATTAECVVVYLDCGCKRHYGVETARINSRLQMECSGGFLNPRNELAKTWPVAQPD